MSARQPFRIASWPHFSERSPNPYQRLFYDALKPYGVEIVHKFPLTNDALESRGRELDAIHFHWPEKAWRWNSDGILQSMKSLLGFQRFLTAAKTRGLRLLWTVHNHEHHEGTQWIDRRGYRLLAKHCDAVICHSRWSQQIVEESLKPKRTVVVYHGNYETAYPQSRLREETLKNLGLSPERPTFCCLGMIRDYKNFELAAEAVSRHDPGAQLVIGGSPHRDYSLRRLESYQADCNRIRLIARRLSDQEFADIGGASDAVILPYSRITGSGAMLAAWSLNAGVIVPNLPYFQEICGDHPGAVEFFQPHDGRSLGEAMQRYCSRNEASRLRSIREVSEEYRWERCVRPVGELIDAWRSKSSRSPAETAEISIPLGLL